MSTTLGNSTASVVSNDSNNTGVVVLSAGTTGARFQTDSTNLLVGNGLAYYNGTWDAGSGTRTQKWRMVIFGDNGASAPTTTCYGVTDPVTLTQSTLGATAQWITFSGWTNFGGAPTLAANTKYWVGIWYGTEGVPGSDPHIGQDNATSGLLTEYYQTGITYSDTSNPSVSSFTNSGSSNAQYDAYFVMGPVSAGSHSLLFDSARTRRSSLLVR